MCEICGGTFAEKTYVRLHKNLVHHNKPPQFKCEICGVAHRSWRKRDYETHLRSHSGEKPFQCSVCGKGFTGKGNLAFHEKLHETNGEAVKVRCEYCPAVAKNKYCLRKHQLKKHPEFITDKRDMSKQLEAKKKFIGIGR